MNLNVASEHKKRHIAIVSVGTNINPEQNLQYSRDLLVGDGMFIAEASIIQTEPDGYQDQPDFLNGAYLLETGMSYDELNSHLKGIEIKLGRVKGPIKSGPRSIDLDIIIWDGNVVHGDYRQKKHYVTKPVDELLQKHSIELLNP